MKLTLDRDLSHGVPALPPPAVDVTIEWATDFETARDESAVGATGSGGALPPTSGSWRARQVYWAALGARVSYAVTHGATMALVKANAATSGPILRKVGFTAFGQEPIYAFQLR